MKKKKNDRVRDDRWSGTRPDRLLNKDWRFKSNFK